MSTSKKPNKAVQFVADAELIKVISEKAKKEPDNSLAQLLNLVLKQPQKIQDAFWWSAFMVIWNKAPSKGKPFTKDDVIGAICNGAKLTKADAGRAVSNAKRDVIEVVDAIAEGSKLTKADAG